jgi:hypothetical protein
MTAYMLVGFDADYDEWKPVFDTDPAKRAEIAKGYTISRAVDNPNEIFVRVELESVEDAKTLRDRLLASGALSGRFAVTMQPTVVEVAETHSY